MLSESTVCAWDAKHIEGQDVVSLSLSLGFEQGIVANLAPYCIPRIAMALLAAYADWDAYNDEKRLEEAR